MAHQGTEVELHYQMHSPLLQTLHKSIVFRSVSEEFKVPDGMVGFSKFAFA